jgi:Bacterial Ig-like domain (group 3)
VSSQNTNIQLRYSDNDGASWSAPQQVNDDSSGNSHFWPRVASNPLSGNVAVCWHDCRNSTTDTAVQLFCTMATPTGSSPSFMPNGKVSEGSSVSNQEGVEFGDYAGLAYFQGVAHPSWADTSNSTGDNPNGTANFDAYSNRVTGGAAAHEGDPHLTTVNGVHYDFQGAGEFVALRDYDGLEIQTRQTPIATSFSPGADPHDGLATCVSLNTAVAARVGTHRVTYEPNLSGVPDPSGLQLRVDGVLSTLPTAGIDLGGGARVAPDSAAPGALEIDFPDETTAYVTPGWWASQSKWYLNLDVSHTPALEGTLGVIRNSTWLPALPDGSLLGTMPTALHQRYTDLYQTFANAWRVTDKTSLFDYAPGTSTATFATSGWPLENPPCVLLQTRPVEPVSIDIAREACRQISNSNMKADCIFDVSVTGHRGFAQTYAASQRILRDSTTTTLSDDPDPSQVGEWVKLTATVAAAASSHGVPAGSVQFLIDGANAGEPVRLNTAGRATRETSHLGAGSHTISAAYLPQPGSVYLPSRSVGVQHAVKRCRCDSESTRR